MLRASRTSQVAPLRLTGAALLLLVQGAGAVAVPLADASLEDRAAGHAPHVEAPSTDHEHPGHEHVTCELCRTVVVFGSFLPTAPVAWRELAPRAVRPTSGRSIRHAVVAAPGLGARGPPLV